ncbi:uncharacterized protein LOC133838472 [Drosophila sulfurigaster albostrigata]|uniref:uncharacterized protein LOC133838472 n=1 Tax=Drosophila sulfurigaster albostrigata TaxID=89887 RepID=UPI002D21E17C|nr:uncharacterized protein LOC133838472 [Drosophila sulfurigaster albostrigata]
MSGNKAVVVLNCRIRTRACKDYKSLKCEIEIGRESSTTLAEMFTCCFGLPCEPQDGAAARLPQQICIDCLPLLKQSYILKRTDIGADELIRLGLEDIGNNNNNSNSAAASAERAAGRQRRQ